MSFTQHFAAISRVFSDCMYICSFQQCQYCEIGNVSMGFSKSLMPKILYKSLVFDSWFDKIFGICDLENPILTFPPHSIVSMFKNHTTYFLYILQIKNFHANNCHLVIVIAKVFLSWNDKENWRNKAWDLTGLCIV